MKENADEIKYLDSLKILHEKHFFLEKLNFKCFSNFKF